MRVAVVGCGYVGLVTGVSFASVGHDVVAVEVDERRRETIARGEAPFHEPGLQELLKRGLEDGSFRVTGRLADVADAEVVFLAVQTPPGPEGEIDLSFLQSAAADVAAVLAGSTSRRPVVAVRSTVVPGTTATVVAPILEAHAAVAANPEFLREGSAVSDFLQPDRVVVGCDDEAGRALLAELYEPLHAPVFFTSPTTAELAKYTSNAFLATLISFSNEIARISESHPGVDVEEVLSILHADRRLSPRVDGEVVRPGILSYLKAGCGYGGSCLPKDLSALLASRAQAGHSHPLLAAVREVNETQRGRVVQLVERELGSLAGRNVTVLGSAFKGGTDDVRASPGLRIASELLERRARVTLYDPLVGEDRVDRYTARGAQVAESLRGAVEGAEAVIVTTDAPEFRALDAALADANDPPLVLDARRVLEPGAVGRYAGVGRGPDA